MTCTTTGFGCTELARCRWACPGEAGGCESDGWLQGDGVAEGFELPDQVVGLAGGVDVAVVEVGAEVVESGGRVGQRMPDDHEDGPGDGDQGLAFASAFDQPPVAFGQERALATGA